MSIEVACPSCGGSIQIEDVSEVVACPLCQMHLEINSETNEPVLLTEDSEEEETAPEESVETTEVNTTTEEIESAEDATPDNDDPGDEQDSAESPFAFLPGGNQTKSDKAKPVRTATNFSFLPGGNEEGNENSEEGEAETSEAASADETTTAETESAGDVPPGNEEQDDAEEASSFAFLPGGNQTKSEKAKPVQPATNFSFLPGGNEEGNEDSEEGEVEALETTSEEAVPEVDAGTPEETLSAEAESVPEETSEETASEETVAEESDTVESDTEDADTEETNTEENVSEEASAEETTSEEMTTEETAAEETTAEETAVDESVTEEGTEAETKTEESSTTEASAEPETPVVQQDYRKGKVVPKRLFTLTLTYAIAATILVAMLLYAKYLGDPHQLESLPDLKPPIKNDEIALQLVPENAKLPAGHTLKLGGPGRRFGNVMVTPLRVTRGPVEFEHYTGDTTKTREPTQDVLKLHLKFENVSRDQIFEPLDQKLLLTRVSGKTQESQMRANNFVCRIDQKRTDAERVLVYDMPPSWEWNLKGQNINQESQTQNLEPGESFETYVATNEAGIDSLKGDLVWRLQLRKGYNPVSYRGVTTLIEVLFNSDQIQAESPSPTKEPLPTT